MTLYQDCSSRHDSSKTWPLGVSAYFFLYIYIEKFKNLLVRNHETHFNIIWQKCFLGDPLPRFFKQLWFVKKYGHQGAKLIFPIYFYRKFKKSYPHKPLDLFQYNLVGMFLWWPSTKIVQAVMIRQKTWPLRDRAYFPYIFIWKTIKIFLS